MRCARATLSSTDCSKGMAQAVQMNVSSRTYDALDSTRSVVAVTKARLLVHEERSSRHCFNSEIIGVHLH